MIKFLVLAAGTFPSILESVTITSESLPACYSVDSVSRTRNSQEHLLIMTQEFAINLASCGSG